MSEFVGVRSTQVVAAFLDDSPARPLRERLPRRAARGRGRARLVAALEAGDYERALRLLLDEVRAADGGAPRPLRGAAWCAIFDELGQEHAPAD